MKYAKYIAAIIFYLITLFVMVLYGTWDRSDLNAHLRFDHPEQIQIKQMAEAAKENHVILYAFFSSPLSLNKQDIIYYTASDEQKTVQKHLGIQDGIIRKPAEGTEQIRFETFDAMTQSISKNISCWYMLGDAKNCKQFTIHLKKRLQYDVTLNEKRNDLYQYTPFGIFLLMVILLLFFCYINASFLKKEISIRIIHGDSVLYHYLKITITETVLFAAIFFAGYLGQRCYTQLYRPCANAYWLLILFFAGIWAVNLHLLHIKPKEVMYGHQLSSNLMLMMFILSTLSSVFACLLIIESGTLMPTLSKYQKAVPFIQRMNDYYFVSIQATPYDSIQYIEDPENRFLSDQRQFLSDSDAELQPITIALEQFDRNATPLWQMLYCNHRALSYFQDVIPESSEADLINNQVVFLLPSSLPPTEQHKAMRYLLNQFRSYEGYMPDEEHIQLIEYLPQTDYMYFNCQGVLSHIDFVDLPVVCIASDTYARPDAQELYINHIFELDSTVFKTSDSQKVKALFQNYRGFPVMSGINELFFNDFFLQKVLVATSLITIILIFLFIVVVEQSILYLDYQVNAVEMAIKKTLGDSILQKNTKHFVRSGITVMIDLAGSCFFIFKMNQHHYLNALIVTVILFVLNILLICFMIRRVEKQKLTKILKGGAL